ncbi:MAG: dihydropteroate synthase [Candidatus Omnitrophota bacterium]
MIIIGERINSSRKRIKEAIGKKDIATLVQEAKSQISNGAKFIDINCATSMERETDDLIWLIKEIQRQLRCPVSIDSPNISVISKALEIHKGAAFINSITAEKEKLKALPFLTKGNKANVVVLAMDENGMPQDAEGRLKIADTVIDTAVKDGVDKQNIYIDPLVKPVSTEPKQAYYFLQAIKMLKDKGINVVGGLSNVSFGLPVRGLLNAAFLKLAIDSGIDAVIIDPTDPLIKSVLDNIQLPQEPFALAKSAILGEDAYSMNYIKAFREGKLNSLV